MHEPYLRVLARAQKGPADAELWRYAASRAVDGRALLQNRR